MSLATDMTQCCARLLDSEKAASAEVRRLRGVAPAPVYEELMLQLCVLASETNRMKSFLGSLRMLGDLEQRPQPVKVEDLELASFAKAPEAGARCVRRDGVDLVDGIDVSERTRRAFAHQLEMIGDDTLSGKEEA